MVQNGIKGHNAPHPPNSILYCGGVCPKAKFFFKELCIVIQIGTITNIQIHTQTHTHIDKDTQ